MWLSREPTAGNKNPPLLAGGGFVEEDFFGKSDSFTTARGICPNDKSKGHRANARVLSFVGAGEKVIHCGR
jgi:hypothetical protein